MRRYAAFGWVGRSEKASYETRENSVMEKPVQTIDSLME
jgi:hypothetical protein